MRAPRIYRLGITTRFTAYALLPVRVVNVWRFCSFIPLPTVGSVVTVPKSIARVTVYLVGRYHPALRALHIP